MTVCPYSVSPGTTVTYQNGVLASQIIGLSAEIEPYAVGEVFLCSNSYCNILHACDTASSNAFTLAGLTVGVLVGVGIGGLVVLILIIVASWACCCRADHKKNFRVPPPPPSSMVMEQHNPVFNASPATEMTPNPSLHAGPPQQHYESWQPQIFNQPQYAPQNVPQYAPQYAPQSNQQYAHSPYP